MPCLFEDTCNPIQGTRMKPCVNGVCAQHQNVFNLSIVSTVFDVPEWGGSVYPVFQCACNAGYVKASPLECVLAPSACVSGACTGTHSKCIESHPGYYCGCEAGFVGRKGMCTSIDDVKRVLDEAMPCNSTNSAFANLEAAWMSQGIVSVVCGTCTPDSIYAVDAGMLGLASARVGVCRPMAARGTCVDVYVYNADTDMLICEACPSGLKPDASQTQCI